MRVRLWKTRAQRCLTMPIIKAFGNVPREKLSSVIHTIHTESGSLFHGAFRMTQKKNIETVSQSVIYTFEEATSYRGFRERMRGQRRNAEMEFRFWCRWHPLFILPMSPGRSLAFFFCFAPLWHRIAFANAKSCVFYFNQK